MRITAEVEVNPGPKALFVAEVKVEKNANITPKWWGLCLGWWLYRGMFISRCPQWRHWLYGWEREVEGGWRTWQARLLGFEINWQRRRYEEYRWLTEDMNLTHEEAKEVMRPIGGG